MSEAASLDYFTPGIAGFTERNTLLKKAPKEGANVDTKKFIKIY